MNKAYKELDKLDKRLKKTGAYDMNREKCFAEISIKTCSALKVKNCYQCNFYKPISIQIDVVIKEIQSYRGSIPSQSLKTLVGQAKAGDLAGAMKGLSKVKRMRGI